MGKKKGRTYSKNRECPECNSRETYYRKRSNDYHCRRCGCDWHVDALGRRINAKLPETLTN
jgi:hypothetical protein